MARRREQAARVVEILNESFGSHPEREDFVVAGDLNDYMPSPGLNPLLSRPWIENVVERLRKEERWTHYYKTKQEYKQLDYLLLSQKLAGRNPKAIPEIIRGGLPLRATAYAGQRFAGVGRNDPKASDHCPVVMALEF